MLTSCSVTIISLGLSPLTTTSMSRSDPGQISSWAQDPQTPKAITSLLALSLPSSLSSAPRHGDGSLVGSKRRILDNSKSRPHHSHPFWLFNRSLFQVQ